METATQNEGIHICSCLRGVIIVRFELDAVVEGFFGRGKGGNAFDRPLLQEDLD